MKAHEFDCERYIRGCEKIDQARYVIKRVINSVFSLLNGSTYRYNKWGKDTIILEILFGGIKFVLRNPNKFFIGDIIKIDIDKVISSTDWTGGIDSVEASKVSLVREHLSEIVQQIDDRFPEVGILEHFKLYIKQVKT